MNNISIQQILAPFRRYVKGSSYPKRNGTRICWIDMLFIYKFPAPFRRYVIS